MQQFLFLIFSLLFITSCNVYTRTSQSFSTELSSGEIKNSGKLKVKKSTQADRFNYYQRWDNEFINYHENGKIKSIHVSHFKVGTYGRPCRELLYKYTEYNDQGVKIFESKDICDCRKSKTIEYNKNGKVLRKNVLKIKRVE